MSRRIRSFVSLFFGVLGVLGCIAVVMGSWSFASRLNRTTASVVDAFERVFSTARQQVATAGERVEALKLNTERLGAGLETWSEKEVAARLSSRLQAEEHLGRLESGLHQTDQWLEAIESSVQVVERAAESGRAIGIAVRTDALEAVLEEVATVRVSLSEVTAPVARISEQVSQLGDEETHPNRASEIVKLTTRLMATFGSIDSQLEALNSKLSEADTTVREARKTVTSWIRLAAATMTLLACWMASGQGSLIYHGIRGLKGPRTGTATKQ